MKLEKGYVYYFGGSGSPSLILITDVTEHMVFYCRVWDAEHRHDPVENDFQISRMGVGIAKALTRTARNTMLKKAEQIGSNTLRAYTINRYANGVPYTFVQTFTCNCCGSDFFEGEHEISIPCPHCGEKRFRCRVSAENLIGKQWLSE